MHEEPQMSLLFDLWFVNHLLTGALDEVLVKKSGLTGEDFGFYSMLRRFGPVTPGQVSRWTAMPATSVSATVRRLARRGDVEQIPNPSDGRSRLIILTPAGVAAHSETASVFFAETRPLAAALGAAEPAQRALLQRLDRALREVSGLDPRPYVVDDLPDEQRQRLDYDGEALLPDEEGTVLAYIDFIRTQRKERGTP